MFPPKKKPQGREEGADDESGARERPEKGGKPNPFEKKGGAKEKPEGDEDGDEDSKPMQGAKEKPEGGDDGWKDGEPFDPKAFAKEHGSAGKRAAGDEEGGFGGKPHAMDQDGDGQDDGDQWKDGDPFDPNEADGQDAEPEAMRVEPHESGAGHKVHFHPDVAADLPADGDYQHHVMEHAKHYAGYLTNKETDPQKAEAHRQAANLHARVGNALHAGGDTAPRRAQSTGGGGLGAPGGPQGPGQPQLGPDGEKLADPNGGFGGGQDFGEQSPGDDVTGNPIPARPDQQRNMPPRDSMIEADRARGGKAKLPPLPLMGKSGVFFGREVFKKGGPYIGPRGGKWADPQHTIPWTGSEPKPHQTHDTLVDSKGGVWIAVPNSPFIEDENGERYTREYIENKLGSLKPGQPKQAPALQPVAKPKAKKEKKEKPLSPKDARALYFARRHGIVPGGSHASFALAYKLQDRGLLKRSPTNTQVLVPTEAGIKALEAAEAALTTGTKKSIKLSLSKSLFDYTW